jgi:hypothetical protein
MKERFPAMVRISERTSEIRTYANGGSGRGGVKGQDERQKTAPLTPSRPPRKTVRVFQLTGVQAVIHGAQLLKHRFSSLRVNFRVDERSIRGAQNRGTWGTRPPAHRDKAAMNGPQLLKHRFSSLRVNFRVDERSIRGAQMRGTWGARSWGRGRGADRIEVTNVEEHIRKMDVRVGDAADDARRESRGAPTGVGLRVG